MNDEKRMIDAPQDVPLLEQEKIEDIGVRYGHRRGKILISPRLRRIYFLSVVILISFLVIIIFMRYDLYRGNLYPDDTDKASETGGESSDISSDTDISVIAPVDTQSPSENKKPTSLDELYSFDYSLVPENATAIVPMDLSMASSGATYINNFTGLVVDANALLSKKFNGNQYEMLSLTEAPKVLIIHTHATEAYSEDGAIFYESDVDEIARSSDNEENVVSLGKLMSDMLNEKGIPTVHCTIMHDSLQSKDSYLRSQKTIMEYLMKYPSIELVIDLHRDSIMKPQGELIRPVTLVDSEAVAQVMCVVGSEWGGESCPAWQDNLSLALKLRERLNADYKNLCRPTELREYTYNQELSKYSMMIEIGSSGNSLEEAKRAVALVTNALVGIIAQI